MSPPPVISVVIVTYERPEAAMAALESVRACADPNWEVIVVDNGSKNRLDLRLLDGLPSATLIRLEQNSGCPAARNQAYERCRGEFIVNVDDDGLLGPHVVPETIEQFRQTPDVGIIAFRRVETIEEARSTPVTGVARDTSVFSGGLCALRRAMLTEIGGYPAEHFLFAEEEHLALRALEQGFRIIQRDDVCMVHPCCGGSGTSSLDALRFRNALANVVELYPALLLIPAFVLRSAHLLRIARQRGTAGCWRSAVRDVLRTWPEHWARRRPCAVRTIRRFFSLRDELPMRGSASPIAGHRSCRRRAVGEK